MTVQHLSSQRHTLKWVATDEKSVTPLGIIACSSACIVPDVCHMRHRNNPLCDIFPRDVVLRSWGCSNLPIEERGCLSLRLSRRCQNALGLLGFAPGSSSTSSVIRCNFWPGMEY